MLYKNMLACIGNTPLVQLRTTNSSSGEIYAKLELFNPFGMKDRVAKHILLKARAQGILRERAPIIESSSGTMALGIALVGTYLGHDIHIVADPRIDSITLAKLYALHAHVHIVEKMTSRGWQSARLEYLAELLQHYPDAFWPRQYENPDNPEAYTELAHELVADLGHIDILVGGVGSGGSLCGTARELRKYNPDVRVVAVDAVGSAIFGQPDQPKRLQGGLGNSLVPANVDSELIDEVHWLSDAEAFTSTLELAAREQIFAGNSSGSVYAVARWLASQVSTKTTIVAIFPDRGDRYVNTIYNKHYRQESGLNNSDVLSYPQQVSGETPVLSWSYTVLAQKRSRDAKPSPLY